VAVEAGFVWDDDSMSDDDLWRRPQDQPPATEPASEESRDGDTADAPVGDETQPISGLGSAPTPPGPSYDPPTGPAAVPPPANPYGQTGAQPAPEWNPYVDPRDHDASSAPPRPTTPYPQAGPPQGYGPGYVPPQNPYVPPQEFSAPHSPYGSPYQPAYAGGLMPAHPSATTSLVLGIIGLVSVVVCAGVLLVLSPFAWALGAKAVRQIDASPGSYAGRDRAQAGKILGIIGSVLLVLGVLAIILLVVVAASSDPTGPVPTYNNQNL
jgi:hypothetical protein